MDLAIHEADDNVLSATFDVAEFEVANSCCVVEPDDVFPTVAEFEVGNSFVAQLSPTTSSFVASRL